MTRTISFRAWTGQEMVYNYLEALFVTERKTYKNEIVPAHYAVIANKTSVVDLMQFTGVCDQRGQEIYEGDILSYYDYTAEVKFANGIFYGNPINGLSMFNWAAPWSWNENVFVIGNIYENPELLGEQK